MILIHINDMHAIILLFIIYLLRISSEFEILLKHIDLTWPFNGNTINCKNNQRFIFTKKLTEIKTGGAWYATNDFCSGEHVGTHFDAPYHLARDGWKVEEVPLARLIVQGITIDLSEETAQHQDNTELLPHHLTNWTSDNGNIPENSVILVKFGWAKYYYDEARYIGIDKEGNFNFPGVSVAAAEWIVDNGNVVGVGVDTASVDAGKNLDQPAHKVLSKHQIYVLKNVKIPVEFPTKDFYLYVMPMKIEAGTGAPLRLIATSLQSQNEIMINTEVFYAPLYGHISVFLSCFILFILLLSE